VPRAVDWAYPSRFEHDETGAGEMPVLQRACETVKCLLKNNPWEFLIFRLGRRRSPKWKKPGETAGLPACALRDTQQTLTYPRG